MQLGARWAVGDPPHRSVPATLHNLIATQEAAHPGACFWTLTWLENRPRCALDDLVIATLDAAGQPSLVSVDHERPGVGADPDDDDWLN